MEQMNGMSFAVRDRIDLGCTYSFDRIVKKQIMNKSKVLIKEPCHMSWEDMDKIQNSNNKHCTTCSIDIVDFTQMSNEEIISYLATRKNEKVCCHMYAVDARSDLRKGQKIVLGLQKKISTSIKNHYFKSLILAFIGLVTFTTQSCTVEGDPVPECRDEFVPDTTTTAPNDSTWVNTCD